jgi:hypothetical protein
VARGRRSSGDVALATPRMAAPWPDALGVKDLPPRPPLTPSPSAATPVFLRYLVGTPTFTWNVTAMARRSCRTSTPFRADLPLSLGDALAPFSAVVRDIVSAMRAHTEPDVRRASHIDLGSASGGVVAALGGVAVVLTTDSARGGGPPRVLRVHVLNLQTSATPHVPVAVLMVGAWCRRRARDASLRLPTPAPRPAPQSDRLWPSPTRRRRHCSGSPWGGVARLPLWPRRLAGLFLLLGLGVASWARNLFAASLTRPRPGKP